MTKHIDTVMAGCARRPTLYGLRTLRAHHRTLWVVSIVLWRRTPWVVGILREGTKGVRGWRLT